MTKITPPKIYTRNNILGLRYSIDGVDKKKSLKMKDTPKNRKLVEIQIIPQFILKIHSGEFFENNNVKVPTIQEYIEKSLSLHRGSRASRTNTLYRQNYNLHIKDVFGKMRLDKITGNDITNWQNDLREKKRLVKSSILRIRSCLYTLFEDAISEDIIKDNPIKKAQRLIETENPIRKITPLQPFKKEEISKILDVLDGSDKNLIATLFYTGMRAGELIGLKWEYVDFENRVIKVRQQIVKGIPKTTLKSKTSRRTIPIIDVLIPYLKQQYELTGSNEYVFLTQKTNKYYHDAGKIRSQIWIKALEKANVKYRNLHQTRGTFISTLINNGEDISYVSKIAGHNNINITLESYAEYIPTTNKNFGNCFN